jgi:chemotaxis protein methyltransferase WspC
MGRYDVVFCRNLLIYLNARARAYLISTIDRLLAIDGVLFIGHADRLESGGMQPRFTPLADAALFAYQRPSPTEAAQLSSQLTAPPVLLSLSSSRAEARRAVTNPTAVPPANLASVLPIDSMPGQTRTDIPSSLLLDRATDFANRGHFEQALAVCEQHLRQKGPTAPTYFLMGMVCQAAGNERRAEDCLQKALYLDPKHDEALLALALLAERRGDHGSAANFRRRAERALIATRKKVN